MASGAERKKFFWVRGQAAGLPVALLTPVLRAHVIEPFWRCQGGRCHGCGELMTRTTAELVRRDGQVMPAGNYKWAKIMNAAVVVGGEVSPSPLYVLRCRGCVRRLAHAERRRPVRARRVEEAA